MNNILLCGNPNVGKSSLFNILTNSHEHTGNWTGKTVELASKKIIGTNYTLIDLPGIYSLTSLSDEEKVAKGMLLFGDYKKIIYVIDGSMLERNLNLLFQILQITKNVIVCINMIDELKDKNILLNSKKLSKILGVTVIECSTFNNIGINDLIDSLDKDNYCTFNYYYDYEIERKINDISSIMPRGFKNRFISLSILLKDKELVNIIKDKYGININSKELDNILMNVNSEEVYDLVSYKINTLCNIVTREVYKNNNKKELNFLDKLFSNKLFSILTMVIILFSIFFLTIVIANYPSELLSIIFNKIEVYLYKLVLSINVPHIIYEPLLFGVYRVVTFIISVMFPPLVIFFILFTYAEEVGLLPRIAFNFDKICNMSGCHGKQCLTMCTGFGCNACAVVGSRIIDSRRDRLIAIVTNSFIPCNGRFPLLIAIITMFLSNNKIIVALYLCVFIVIAIIISFLVSFILSKTLLKGYPGFFILELPNYKKVKFTNILKKAVVYKSLSILKKAIIVSMPCGIIIYMLNHIIIHGSSLFLIISSLLNPFALLIGLDGVILLSFLLALPANEIVMPIIIMGYLGLSNVSMISDYTSIKSVLISNGWSVMTAISVIMFSIMHFPCGTTLATIKEEVGNKWMIYSFLIPLCCGIIILFIFNLIA